MAKRFWERDIFELADAMVDAVVRFWKEDIWPLMMGASFFFFLAVPLLLVMLVLWYLDSIGWAPEHGRYKVGAASVSSAVAMSASVTPATANTQWRQGVHAVAPPRVNSEIT